MSAPVQSAGETGTIPPREHIRSFCIIAHIDHGKSTLADRLMEHTGLLGERDKAAQYLDRMDIERERGITIKAQAVRMRYQADDGREYQLDLIDTPGHVDFNYEVSRSLAACDGALLVVDAAQGVEAQTLANVYLALDADLEIIPVINKIDLPSADIEAAKEQIEEMVGLDASQAICVSAKTGVGIDELLEAIVTYLPPPRLDPKGPLRALIIDSWWDTYRGVISLVRVMSGTLLPKQEVRFVATNKRYDVLEVGVFSPEPLKLDKLEAGEVGFMICNVKEVVDSKVGDTVVLAEDRDAEALPGFKEVQQMVFAGVFPTDSAQYADLRDALGKLTLNDASVTWEPETSEALGFGFRLGFLGLLHMEIIQERLEREYNLDLITTAPSVKYRVTDKTGEVAIIDNPAHFADAGDIEMIEEPMILGRIQLPEEHLGPVMKLCQERRGIQRDLSYMTTSRVQLTYELPLAEVVFGFYDQLKSISRGYASLDYEHGEYRRADLVRLDLLVNGEKVDALSLITHRDKAFNRGRDLCVKMKEEIPRQQFEVAIQAAVGSRIIARTTVKALRKNVLAKCYGGDASRKRKLLEKQKKGKKRLKAVGNVEIPQGAFHAILKLDS
ncbi:elongation factor 4 [Pseudenhygromyxa sp. WMMC2535]|uniref:translation elongation factor 4 n=1 Tax=Pseudenhygromyxa sp. WMMC2535 TaxID=2712867 RepID=UPI0015517AF5|nr:translation elongation factor 4 [Pseudenhygromyxa sp. WMMC2535]NVB41755.1 elongation factor 4 [Pseudenhygromyxa sp. WMMC2535]